MGISTVLDTQVLATSGADGDVLTQQADGTYLAETPSAGGSPGGSTGQIQYNNASAFGGTVALVYAASGTHFTVTAQAATDVPVVVKGHQVRPLISNNGRIVRAVYYHTYPRVGVCLLVTLHSVRMQATIGKSTQRMVRTLP